MRPNRPSLMVVRNKSYLRERVVSYLLGSTPVRCGRIIFGDYDNNGFGDED